MSLLFDEIPGNPLIDRFIDLSYAVSERIIRILKEKGLTQKELAALLNKSESEISKWLRGNHNFTLKTIAAIEVATEEEFIKILGLEEPGVSHITGEFSSIDLTCEVTAEHLLASHYNTKAGIVFKLDSKRMNTLNSSSELYDKIA